MAGYHIPASTGNTFQRGKGFTYNATNPNRVSQANDTAGPL